MSGGNSLFMLLLLWCGETTTVKVEVQEGVLEGQILVPSTGKGKYYSFKGIPYAAPPVGDLRFMAPQPPLKYDGVRNATLHGSVCVQYAEVTNSTTIGDEDCLFLNVYSPDITPTKLMPVMFYIHGGFFITGSGNDNLYSSDFLMDYNIVLVTINYRLDVLGFLSAKVIEASGNAGLKDQIAALKWVKRNIRNFGGDPKRVTIFGDSAGGGSVSLHMISPAAKGLFQRAIAMSGTWLNDIYIEFEPVRRAFTLAKKLGLETNDPHKMIAYLKKLPAKKLISIRPDIILSDNASASLLTTVYFTPVVEKKFGNGVGQYITKCFISLMRSCKTNKADLLIGHTALEGLRDALLVEKAFFQYYPNYKQLLVPLKISYNRSPKTVLKVAYTIKNFYFGNRSISMKTIKELVTYYTYSHYVYNIHSYIENLCKLPSTRRFFYSFSLYASRNIYSKPGAKKFGIREATHMDDLPYLFYGSDYNLTGQATKYVQLMCRLYTNFAKYGTPTPDDSLGLIWPEYDPKRSAVDIGVTGELSPLTVSYSPNTSVGFWHQLYQSVGIDL